MIVKVKDKEYSFDGYVNPINSVQKLIVDVYQQGREDAIDEFVELINTMPTYENEYGEIMPMPIEMMAEQLKE